MIDRMCPPNTLAMGFDTSNEKFGHGMKGGGVDFLSSETGTRQGWSLGYVLAGAVSEIFFHKK